MIIKNSGYNLIGFGAPLLAAILTIPPLIDILGAEKFGILTLIWAIVSYFGIFDLGLGKALTQKISELISLGKKAQIGKTISTGLLILTTLGVFSGFIVIAITAGIEFTYLSNNKEVKDAIIVLALALPSITLTSGIKSILESYNKFKELMPIRIATGIYTFVAPLAISAIYEPRLDLIAWTLSAGRLIGLYIHWKIAAKELKQVSIEFEKSCALDLLKSGGWLTISNTINPLIGYLDRFIIAAVLAASFVAYYTTPQEMIIKLWIIPGALTTALFPSLVEKIAKQDKQRWNYFTTLTEALFWIMLPITIILATKSKDILEIWINKEFASNSGMILSIFAFGILINCLAHMPLTWLQAEKNYKLSALITIIQLPFYVATVIILTDRYGIIGTAIAWFTRITVDSALLWYYCSRHNATSISKIIKYCIATTTIFTLAIADMLNGLEGAIICLTVLISALQVKMKLKQIS